MMDIDNSSNIERADAVMGAWYRRAREAQFAHYAAGNHYAALAQWLGIPSIMLSAAAGTTLFATLQQDSTSASLRLAVGLVSVVAATLSALQTYTGFAQLAEKHRTAGATYGAVRREIEQYQALNASGDHALEVAFERIRKRLDDAAATAPDVSARIWAKARHRISHTTRPEGFRQKVFDKQSHPQNQNAVSGNDRDIAE